tara:strand:- start:2904 stop:4592 length:1689 start_codon:yes stop_codon:yes gene_type:complete
MLQDRADVWKFNQGKGLGVENLLVIHNTDDPRALELAEYYCQVRNVPSDQLLALTPTWPENAAQADTGEIEPAVELVRDKVASLSNHILTLLFVGDWPIQTNRNGWNVDNGNIGFYDCFRMPDYFLGLAPGEYFEPSLQNNEDRTLGWTIGDNNYPQGIPAEAWPGWRPTILSTPQPSWRTQISPYFKPIRNQVFHMSPACLPLGNYADAVAVGKANIDSCIAAEAAEYQDVGKVILSNGSSSNTVCVPAYAEIVGENIPYTELYWAGLDTLGEAGIPGTYYDHAIADYDPLNEVRVPGDPLFASPTDVAFMIHGNRAYYSGETARVEKAGDYTYRDGALTMWCQSYGATPSPALTVNWYNTQIVVETNPLTAVDANARGYVFLEDGIGNKTNALRLQYNGGGVATCETNATHIICYVGGIEEWSFAYAGIVSAEDLHVALVAAASVDWTVNINEGQFRDSRTFASWRNGCAINIGTTREPNANGDPCSHALMTSLWYGLSIAEWQQMMIAGEVYIQTDVYTSSQLWRNNIIYGDPLYRPFGHLSFALPTQTPNMLTTGNNF